MTSSAARDNFSSAIQHPSGLYQPSIITNTFVPWQKQKSSRANISDEAVALGTIALGITGSGSSRGAGG